MIDQIKIQQMFAKEALKSFGTLGVVIYYRALQHGSKFDTDLYKQVGNAYLMQKYFPDQKIQLNPENIAKRTI